MIDISLRPLSLDRRYHQFPLLSQDVKLLIQLYRFLDACADAVNKIYPNNSRPEGVTDVKVAVVDSGVRVDKILFNIVKGETSVQNSDGRPAPWYTCKDPHGTHMAMLIKDVNPHCELYAHRIKGGYHELINPNTAEQVCRHRRHQRCAKVLIQRIGNQMGSRREGRYHQSQLVFRQTVEDNGRHLATYLIQQRTYLSVLC